MSPLLLVLALLTPAGVTGSEEWARIGATYALPPLALTYAAQNGDELAASVGIDAQGRAVIVFDPAIEALGPIEVRRVTAHESLHAFLRSAGVPYMGLYEERIANAFSYCWIGPERFGYVPDPPCADSLSVMRLR